MTPKTFLAYGITVCMVYTGLTLSKVAIISPSPDSEYSSDGSSGSGGGGSYYRWPYTGYHK